MADTTTHSRNRTYRGAAGAGVPRLAALHGIERTDTPPQRVLEIERYDTDDRRLAAAGIVLEVHRPGDEAYWRLDLPDGSGTERLRVPVGDEPDVMPADLAQLVRSAAREQEMRPAGRVRRVRAETRLLGPGDRVRAVVVHDHVTVATLGPSTDVETWTDVELQCTDADEGLVRELEERFAESGLRPATTMAEAELDRMLRPEPRTQPARGGGKAGSAGAVVVDYIAAHVDRLAEEDLRARRGEPDSVHQLRVASRRIRSALQAYRRLFDRERTDPVVSGLRELGRALAPARDAEVLHARIRDELAGLEPELKLGPVQAEVTRHFARVEGEASAAVLSTLDGEEYVRLRAALDDLVQRRPLSARAARPARKELPQHVARTARRLERAMAKALDPAVEKGDRDAAVHEARKAGKRLRYATEVATPVVGKDAKRFTKALKGFQQALGEHQDTVVARGVLRELGAQAHKSRQNGFTFGLLFGRDAARAARIEEELPGLWATAWTRRNRRWLR